MYKQTASLQSFCTTHQRCRNHNVAFRCKGGFNRRRQNEAAISSSRIGPLLRTSCLQSKTRHSGFLPSIAFCPFPLHVLSDSHPSQVLRSLPLTSRSPPSPVPHTLALSIHATHLFCFQPALCQLLSSVQPSRPFDSLPLHSLFVAGLMPQPLVPP